MLTRGFARVVTKKVRKHAAAARFWPRARVRDHDTALVTMVVVYQNPDVGRNRSVNLNLMKRQKVNKTLKPPKDQTRLAAIQMVFTPEECLQLIAEFTPQL